MVAPFWSAVEALQARELAEKYPTLEEARAGVLVLALAVEKTAEGEAGNAEVWSQNMLMLRDARQDLHAGSGPRPALSR